MARIPKRTSYKKQFKGRVKTISVKDNTLQQQYGIMAVQAGRISEQQIEACRRAIVRHIQRKGKLAINIFPDIPVTAKPKEVRMGRGKGSVSHWICRVRKGKLLFQLDGVSRDLAQRAFRLGRAKLPLKTTWIERKKDILMSDERSILR